MPELPDITVYVERLAATVVGQTLVGHELRSAFLLRTVSPRLDELHGQAVRNVGRLGKRIWLEFEGGAICLLHLMIAGRLRWRATDAKLPGHTQLALRFGNGQLLITEAGSKRRASLYVVAGQAELKAFDRGGLDVANATAAQFGARLASARHTLKRALTDPTLFDGIGNAYSDEILHAAKLSPFRLTTALSDLEIAALQAAIVAVLARATADLRAEVGSGFPEEVTAFRASHAVHGKYNQPCPVCGHLVQRIRYADNECNYCASCQTAGNLLADRSLSRLLKADWPKTLAELEERKAK